MKIRFAISLSLLLCAQGVFAGAYLAQDATITKIGNADQNQDKFFVTVSGGQVTCPTITFTVDAAPSQKAFDRSFAMAMAAQATGKRVTIFNYNSTSCSGASYIEVYN
jgi:hypothetical protein